MHHELSEGAWSAVLAVDDSFKPGSRHMSDTAVALLQLKTSFVDKGFTALKTIFEKGLRDRVICLVIFDKPLKPLID